MNEFEHQRELLKTKIEAHRTILGLEFRAAGAAFDPVGAALSLVGVDRAVVDILLPILRATTAHLTSPPDGDASTVEAAEPAQAPQGPGSSSSPPSS